MNLKDNNIGSEGAQALLESLEKNSSLMKLDCEGNKVGAEMAFILVKFLEINLIRAELYLEDDSTCILSVLTT